MRGRVQDAIAGRPKVAIVTGGSSGIGLEMVKKLIEKGYRVVANSRNITSAMTLHNTADLKLVDGDIFEETAKTCRGYRNSEFWKGRFAGKQRGRLYSQALYRVHRRRFSEGNADKPGRILLCVATRGGANASPEIRTRRQHLHVVGKPAYRRSPASLLNLTKAGLESVTRALAIEFAAEGIRFNAIPNMRSMQ